MSHQTTVSQRAVGEWQVVSSRDYQTPFVDVRLDAVFTSPSGTAHRIPGFYDGDGTWRVRFSPAEPGRWTYRTMPAPADPDLATEGSFEVTPRTTRGFLRATPGDAWGFRYESGEPALLIGDTAYNLFAETYLGNDVRPYLHRRAQQGFGLLRISVVALPFCPPNVYARWADRRIWPWGGSDWFPQFDRFDLGYFRAVDETVRQADEAGLGIELVMQFPGTASPFGRRDLFTAEAEELWIRYLVARYDAYASVYVWTLSNEYEFLTNEYRHNPVADQWALRVARLVKQFAPHGHPVAVHNGPTWPPFADRFRADPEAVDVVMYQDWGTKGPDDAWLAAGIDDSIVAALAGWPGSAVLAEYGYELDPGLADVTSSWELHLDPDHTRRGAWRGAFRGLGVVAGFDNQWWGFGDYDKDQPGVAALTALRHFLTEVVSFARLRPDDDVVVDGPTGPGRRPLALATADRRTVAVYLPVGGTVTLDAHAVVTRRARWYDPRTAALAEAVLDESGRRLAATSPGVPKPRPDDWVLVIGPNPLPVGENS